MNRAERDAIAMKSDLTTYENKRDLISDLDPGPRYPEQALMPERKVAQLRNAKYNLERIRSSAITKKRNEARFTTGRLHAHYKLEQLKTDVAEIRDKELLESQEKVN